MNYQKQFDNENTKLEELIWHTPGEPKKNWFETIFQDLEPKLLKPNGKINWMWVIWNIGKIIAKLVYAIKIQPKLPKIN